MVRESRVYNGEEQSPSFIAIIFAHSPKRATLRAERERETGAKEAERIIVELNSSQAIDRGTPTCQLTDHG